MYVVMPPTSQCGFIIAGSVSFQNSAVRQSGTQRAPGCLPEVSIIVPGGSDCYPINFAVGVLTVFNGSAPHLPGLADAAPVGKAEAHAKEPTDGLAAGSPVAHLAEVIPRVSGCMSPIS